MIATLAFLFVLGVLIFVHELGHFLVARLHGVRVLVFSLGFGPKIFKMQRGATEYCVSAVPLGGYVKLAGETTEEERTGAPDEFVSKSKWVRFQVYLAGPIMNVLLAWALLTVVLLRGADVPLYESSAPVIGTIVAGKSAAAAGLKVGDRITRIGDHDVATWDDLDETVAPFAGRPVAVTAVRDGRPFTVEITPESVTTFDIGVLGVGPAIRPQIATVLPGGAAAKAGLQRGDVLLAADGTRGLDQPSLIKKLQSSPGRAIVFTIERAGQTMDVKVVPEDQGGIGRIGAEVEPYEVRRIDPNLAQAAWLSVKENRDTAVLIGRTLRGIVTAQTPVKQLIGPVAIAQLSGEAAAVGWIPLLDLMAMLSLNLGLLNLMPVPVLDGGNIAILAAEGVARRDLSLRVKERILLAGAALIVMLMATAIYNDVMRLVR